jgi:hypothetical protein
MTNQLQRQEGVMRRSKKITLVALGAAVLTAGCGQADPPPPAAVADQPRPADRQPLAQAEDDAEVWHDADGNPIPEEWKEDENGNLVPAQHPHDSHGRPWVHDHRGVLVAPLVAAGVIMSRRTGPGPLPGPAARPGPRGTGAATRPPQSTPPAGKGGFGATGGTVSGGTSGTTGGS